jgi:hypothetical protein
MNVDYAEMVHWIDLSTNTKILQFILYLQQMNEISFPTLAS